MGIIRQRPIEEQAAFWCAELDDSMIGNRDPLWFNQLAFELGRVLAELRDRAADLDLAKKQKRIERVEQMRNEGKLKTEAAVLVESDPAYVDASKSAQLCTLLRDRVEVYYEIAYQRAYLLNRGMGKE